MQSQTEVPKLSQVVVINNRHFDSLMRWRGLTTTNVGALSKVVGFNDHNYLIGINQVFSNMPMWSPVDRTQTIKQPIKYHVPRPWRTPTQSISLNLALESRVRSFVSMNAKINLLWSGGIDSTVAATAFLKHLPDLSQLRIIYSPWSKYEHPNYLDFLKKFPQIELINQSEERYLNLNLDGVYVSGDCGDELNGSIDESFLKAYGYETLFSSWKDFFQTKNSTTEFISFCERFFALSGRNIQTVLEARWWFYTSCKLNSILHETKIPYFTVLDKKLYGFLDCYEYEAFVFDKIDQIMPNKSYASWRQHLKDYCFEFDGLREWQLNKTKFGSSQLGIYTNKKLALADQRWVMILNDGTRIFTPGLPIFSKLELENKYGTQLDHLFNEPD